MKNKLYPALCSFFILSLSLFLFSCNNSSTNQSQKAESGSDFLKNNPDYNRNAIDTKAPVIEVNLSVSGNTMAEMKFSLDNIKVKSGSTIKLILKNGSTDMAMMHNFVLVDPEAVQQVADLGLKAGKEHDFVPDIASVYVHTKMTMPGETDSITFPAPPVGTYKFICTYPGHYSMMQGAFIVE